MKKAIFIMVVFGFLLAGTITHASDRYQQRIAKCIADNTDVTVKTDIIKKYCFCMSYKMGANETESISQWEKTHPIERAECDREAGWK